MLHTPLLPSNPHQQPHMAFLILQPTAHFFLQRNAAHRHLNSLPTRRSSDLNIQTACLIMEGAEFTENIINGVERPVKAAELFAFTLRVRAGNTDVLTDAEENVRQKLRAEGVM